MDNSVIGWTLALAGSLALILAALPAAAARRAADTLAGLHSDGGPRATAGRPLRILQGSFVAGQLALALVRNAHPEVEPILQRAVWNGSWNRSVLAAAVVKSTSGMRRLYHWATKPPASATSADIRRLGFAIGELGGLAALQGLSRQMGSGADRPALQGALLGALSTRTH